MYLYTEAEVRAQAYNEQLVTPEITPKWDINTMRLTESFLEWRSYYIPEPNTSIKVVIITKPI